MEDDRGRVRRTPILVENPCAVLGGDRAHVVPFCSMGTCRLAPASVLFCVLAGSCQAIAGSIRRTEKPLNRHSPEGTLPGFAIVVMGLLEQYKRRGFGGDVQWIGSKR